MTLWIACGPTGQGVRAFAMTADRIVAEGQGPDEATALQDMPDAPFVRIGDGPASRLPASVLPETGKSLPVWDQDSPPDIIGAWVRLWIAGFLAARPNWDGVICASQADVTHWIHLSANEAVSSQSLLTPRLVAALDGAPTADAKALSETLSRPERLAAHLRAAEVAGRPKAITGHLLGAELAATRPYWLGQEVAVIADNPEPHVASLSDQGVPVTAHDPETLLRPGLVALGRALRLSD
ncbi:2-dehydro-3-deoxygalactonokinase [Roseovarius aestuariivivens]|uniref:2-dehydro-3-deoxygalactonokinase n=1 Tax=Roseovarius aestuariivivens TaxID=1888910 RepID=UPI00107FD533|nr:2-dehydro-3-deoxygalactonokinase [Roseovarius aestuariivivens]